MKILIFSGSHARHLFVHKAVLKSGATCAAIVMERENPLPSPPDGINEHDKHNYVKHFSERYELEKSAFGELRPESIFSDIPTLFCTPETLSTTEAAKFAKKFAPDLAFIFGTDIIKDPLLSCLPQDRVNLHLGLSPWYRGSATLFWPFYFLQPQFAGATFHQILPEADAGQILHQCVPDLRPGDGIHDVGVRTVQSAQLALGKLLDSYADRGGWAYQEQRSTGRLFLTRDFQSSHLRVIYDLYDNKIVDAYLNGEIEQRIPRLVGAPDL